MKTVGLTLLMLVCAPFAHAASKVQLTCSNGNMPVTLTNAKERLPGRRIDGRVVIDGYRYRAAIWTVHPDDFSDVHLIVGDTGLYRCAVTDPEFASERGRREVPVGSVRTIVRKGARSSDRSKRENGYVPPGAIRTIVRD